jgi:hypothetical protein
LECPFGDYLRGRGANIEITFHLVRNPEIKIGEAPYANRCGFVLTIGGTLRKSILSDAAEIVDEIQYFFEVVCSTIFLYQVRSGYFRAEDVRHLVYILGFVEIISTLDAAKCIPCVVVRGNPDETRALTTLS